MFKPSMFAVITFLCFTSPTLADVDYLMLAGALTESDIYYDLSFQHDEPIAPEPIAHKQFATKTTAMQAGSMYLPDVNQPTQPEITQPEVRYMQCANGMCVVSDPLGARVYRQAAEPACGAGVYQAAEPACGSGAYAEAACGSGAYTAEANCGSGAYGRSRAILPRLRIFQRLARRY